MQMHCVWVQRASGGAGVWGGGIGRHPTMTSGSGTLGFCDLPQMWGDLSQTWQHQRSLP